MEDFDNFIDNKQKEVEIFYDDFTLSLSYEKLHEP